MVFIGVYKAVYDYAPQTENELGIKEGDLLFVLEKGDDGWWKAKKKAQSEDEEEPEGDIPNNYVEEVSFAFHQFYVSFGWTLPYLADNSVGIGSHFLLDSTGVRVIDADISILRLLQ